MKRCIVLWVCACCLMPLSAQVVKGKVWDAESGEPLTGASVYLKELKEGTISRLDGGYSIKVRAGNYTLVCSYLGYRLMEKQVKVMDGTTNVDFSLKGENTMLEGVVVTGTMDKESDLHSLKMEKTATGVMNVLSARAIEISPDQTVANVLQRVSGISLEKTTQGEGKYPIIRGMDKRYSYTLVNGVKIPSPTDKNRYVPMDLFPSELLERLEVSKALTPDMEGDAIGGAMNLVMKSAPDRLHCNANLSVGYSTMLMNHDYRRFDTGSFMKKSPAQLYGKEYLATPSDFTLKQMDYTDQKMMPDVSAGLSIGSRFLDNRLGIIVSGSFQNTYRYNESTFFEPFVVPNAGNEPAFANVQLRNYSTQLRRTGVHAKADYRFNECHDISLYGLYLNLFEAQSRSTVDSLLTAGRLGSGSGIVQQWERSRIQTQSISNVTLQGHHTLWKSLRLQWTGAYSKATNDLPGWTEFKTQHTVYHSQPTDDPVILPFKYIWQDNSDNDKTLSADAFYSFRRGKTTIDLSAGVLYRMKHRKSYYNSYDFRAALVDGKPQVFQGYDRAELVFSPVENGYGNEINSNHYTSDENILGYYSEVKLKLWNRLQVTGGVRMENTLQEFETMMPDKFEGKSGRISYSDVLPGVHLKYELTGKQNLRFSVFKSISRPGFFEVIPYYIIGEDYSEGGNPQLKRTKATSFDLRYEWFPSGADQLLAGVFYKIINDPIEHAYVNEGTKGAVLRPGNFGKASNYGFELVGTKYVGNFGLTMNYTYTDSRITTDKATYDRQPNGDILMGNKRQTRPLQGQSRHIANLSLLYKDAKHGLNVQLASVYTGKRINQISPYYGLDYWQQAMVTLDFSAEKRIFKGLVVFVKLNNLLDRPLEVRIEKANTQMDKLPMQDNADYYVVQKDRFGRSGSIGVRYRL